MQLYLCLWPCTDTQMDFADPHLSAYMDVWCYPLPAQHILPPCIHKHPVHQTAPEMNSVAHVLVTLLLAVFVHWLLLLVVSNFDVAVVAFGGVILVVVVFFFLVEDVEVLFQVVVFVLVLMLLFLLLFLSLLFVLSDWWFYHTNSQKAYLFTDTQPEWDTSRYWEASAGSGALGDFPDGSCSNRCGDKTSGCSHHKPLL